MSSTAILDTYHHVWDVREQDWITGDALGPLRRDLPLADRLPCSDVVHRIGAACP